VRQGDHHRQYRGRQKEDKDSQNDYGDSPMTPRLFKLMSVLYYFPRLLNVRLCGTNGILSWSSGTCPPWPGFLANTGSPIIP